MPAVRRSSASAGELGGGDRLELISDAQLRSLLRQADAERIFVDGQLPLFRTVFERHAPVIEPHMDWRFSTLR